MGDCRNFSVGWMRLHSLGRGYALLQRTWLHLLYNLLLLNTRRLWLGLPMPSLLQTDEAQLPHLLLTEQELSWL